MARHAGVGRGTVSRVINGSPKVAEDTRTAVLAAIKELGYVPNQAARTLVTQRTDTVALVVTESQEWLWGSRSSPASCAGPRSSWPTRTCG
ncbi:hypothetical protein GCM10029992_16730 [Glycomyces albus]